MSLRLFTKLNGVMIKQILVDKVIIMLLYKKSRVQVQVSICKGVMLKLKSGRYCRRLISEVVGSSPRKHLHWGWCSSLVVTVEVSYLKGPGFHPR